MFFKKTSILSIKCCPSLFIRDGDFNPDVGNVSKLGTSSL